jgi:hypothetical protein
MSPKPTGGRLAKCVLVESYAGAECLAIMCRHQCLRKMLAQPGGQAERLERFAGEGELLLVATLQQAWRLLQPYQPRTEG